MSTQEDLVQAGRNFVKREGWLGFVLIVGVLLLAFYVWTNYQQTQRITQILEETQRLQAETLEDRKVKTQAIQANTQVMQQLGVSQERSADNIRSLVAVVGSRIEHDKITNQMRLEQTERFMAAIKDTQAATEKARETLRELKAFLRDGRVDE